MLVRALPFLVMILAVAACDFSRGAPCAVDADCESDAVCVAGFCTARPGEGEGEDGEGEGGPPALLDASGSGQTGVASEALAEPFAVTVRDAESRALEGIQVTFVVTEGGGTLSSREVTTGVDGVAATTLTLGAVAGITNRVEGHVAALPAVGFSALALTGEPKGIVTRGGGQTGAVRTTLPDALSVTVVDASDNPVPGAVVSFVVTAGGGSLSPLGPETTNEAGEASKTFTLGSVAGLNEVEATVEGVVGVSAFFQAGASSGNAASIELASALGATGTAGETLGDAFVVTVFDVNGNPVESEPVTFAVTAGGGTLSPDGIVVTDALGNAQTNVTLGTLAGIANTVTATVGGIAGPVTVTVSGVPGPAAQISLGSGDGQTGVSGATLAQVLRVIVKDQHNNLVENETVTWATTAGNGSVLNGTSINSNASGQADKSFTLGTTLGTNTVAASATGLNGSPVIFNATGVCGSGFIDSNGAAPGGTCISSSGGTCDAGFTDSNAAAAGGTCVATATGSPALCIGGTTDSNGSTNGGVCQPCSLSSTDSNGITPGGSCVSNTTTAACDSGFTDSNGSASLGTCVDVVSNAAACDPGFTDSNGGFCTEPPKTNLLAWFMVDAGIVLDGAGRVSQWASKTGSHVLNAQSAPGLIDSGTALNGHAVVRFTGAQALTLVGNSSIALTTGEVYVVSKNTGHVDLTTSGQVLADCTQGNHQFRYASASSMLAHSQAVTTKFSGTLETEPALTSFQSIRAELTATQFRLLVDGQLQATTTSDPAGVWRISSLGSRCGSESLDGDIAEILIYESTDSDVQDPDDVLAVENYLGNRFGVSRFTALCTGLSGRSCISNAGATACASTHTDSNGGAAGGTCVESTALATCDAGLTDSNGGAVGGACVTNVVVNTAAVCLGGFSDSNGAGLGGNCLPNNVPGAAVACVPGFEDSNGTVAGGACLVSAIPDGQR